MKSCDWHRRADDLVRKILLSLPEELAHKAVDCRIVLNRQPPDDSNDGLLGLFEGPALHESPPTGVEGMPVITLFLHNIADYCDHDPDAFDEEVEVTLLHELGHYFGWDEEDLEARGLD